MCVYNESDASSDVTANKINPLHYILAIPMLFTVGSVAFLSGFFDKNKQQTGEPIKHGIITLIICWYMSISLLLSGVSVIINGHVLAGICWLLGGVTLCPILNKEYKIRYKAIVCFVYFLLGTQFM